MPDDREYLLYAYQGNAHAVGLVLSIAEISHIWDDLIDGDKVVADERINRAFTIALIEIPKNPFYQAHCLDLLPVMTTGAINWLTANEYEKSTDAEAHALAHVMRYGIADISLYIAYLIGGIEWAQEVSPHLRRIAQKDTLHNYQAELSNSYEQETAEYLAHGLHIFQSSMFAETELEHVQALYKMIAPPKGAVVVDMGCGIGEVSRLMSAMDRSAQFFGVTNCRAQNKEIIKRGGVTPVLADFHNADMPSGFADVVMFNESIGYGDHAILISEAHRMLKDGGILFIKDFVSDDGNPVCVEDWGYTTLDQNTLASIIASCGFDYSIEYPPIDNTRYADFYQSSELMQQLHPRLYSSSKTAVWRCVKQGAHHET